MRVRKRNVKKILVSILFCVVVISGFLFGGCGVDRDYAKSKVEKHLKSIGRSVAFLNFDPKRTSKCNYSFIYKSGASKFTLQ